MKKYLYIIILLIFGLFNFTSCFDGIEDSVDSKEYLYVQSNIDSIDESINDTRAVAIGHKIVGVLLKYHNGNQEETFTGIKLKNKQVFYVEYLGEIKSTHYGMDFNYVLWVPNLIQEIYENGNGVNPNSENPFWWYMNTYYSQSIEEVRNDWKGSIQFLMNNRKIIYPSKEDVKDFWKASYSESLDSKNANNQNLSSNVGIYYYDNLGVHQSNGVEFSETAKQAKKNDLNCKKQIFIRPDIPMIYFSGSGISSTYEAMLWYLETYCNISSITFSKAYELGNLASILSSCSSFPKPQGKDVKQVLNTVKVDYDSSKLTLDSYNLSDVNLYDSDILVVKNTSNSNYELIQNKDRIYFSLEDDNIELYFPMKYFQDLNSIVFQEKNVNL